MARRRCFAGLLPAFAGLLALTMFAGSAVADYVGGLNPMGDNFLSLRVGPGTRYPEMLRLGPDTYVTVIGQAGNWLRVRLDDGTVGWAYSRYIYPGEPPAPDTAAEPPPPDTAVSRRRIRRCRNRSRRRRSSRLRQSRRPPLLRPLRRRSPPSVRWRSG